MEHFLEARKSTSSKSSSKSGSKSSHHTTVVYTNSHSHGGHLPLKTVLIIIGVVVGIIVAILLIYAFVHHREYKKGTHPDPIESYFNLSSSKCVY